MRSYLLDVCGLLGWIMQSQFLIMRSARGSTRRSRAVFLRSRRTRRTLLKRQCRRRGYLRPVWWEGKSEEHSIPSAMAISGLELVDCNYTPSSRGESAAATSNPSVDKSPRPLALCRCPHRSFVRASEELNLRSTVPNETTISLAAVPI